MLHGMKDEISNPNYAKDLFDRIPSSQKKMFLYPNGFHELFNDVESPAFKRDIVSFLSDILKNNPPLLGCIL